METNEESLLKKIIYFGIYYYSVTEATDEATHNANDRIWNLSTL